MRTFIYTETGSDKRGYNKCITVYRVKHNKPEEVAQSDHNTASWKGARGQANTLVARLLNLRSFDGYMIGTKDVRVIAL